MPLLHLMLSCAVSCGPVAFLADDTTPQATPAKFSAPFEMLQTKHMAIKIMVNGKGPFRVIFDTGAPISLVSSKLAEETELVKPRKRGSGGSMPMMFGMQGQATIKEFGLGELKALNVQVIVMDHPAVTAVSKVLGRIDGIIGFPFFARYRMSIDYQKQTLIFEPSDYNPGDVMANLMRMMMSTRGKPLQITMGSHGVWGFTAGKTDQDEEDGVEISHVFAGSSAAAAGLKPGDRLLVLDGTWTDTVQDCYRAAGKVKPGRAASLKIRREGKEMALTMTPRPGL